MSLDLTIPILEPFTDASLGELPAVPVRRTIEQIISPRIFSCQPETSVVEAARLMREAAVERHGLDVQTLGSPLDA